MYIHFRKNKIIKFSVLIGGIFVLVFLTLFFNSNFVKKYLNINYLYLKVESSVKSFAYKHNFFPRNESTARSLKFTSQAIPVLLYHGIVNTPGQFTITQKHFSEEMTALKNAGYSTITLSDLDAFLHNKEELPAKSFLLTFDDARQDSFIGADPILKSLGFNAVMFVPTSDVLNADNLGQGYYLSTEQLNEMVASRRWELGSHAMQQTGDNVAIDANNSRADFLSNKMWLADKKRVETESEYDARIAKELTQSRLDLQKKFDISVNAFAYPSSDFGQLSTNNIKNAQSVIFKYISQNYQMAFQQVSPTDNQYTFNYPGDNMYYLHRIEPGSDWDSAKLLSTLESAQAKSLPDNNMFGVTNVWKKIWGTMTQNSADISLITTTEKSSAGTFLDGTKNWKDYQYVTTVSGDPVEAVTLYARYQDANNYLACTFTSSYVKISESVNGSVSKLIQTRYTDTTSSKNSNYGIAVSDKNVVCSKEGVALLGTPHDNRITNGGIGLSVWDPIAKKRSVAFSNISATEVSSIELPPKVDTITPPKPVTPQTAPVSTVLPAKNPAQGDPVVDNESPANPISLPYNVTNFNNDTLSLWKTILGSINTKYGPTTNTHLLVITAPSNNTTAFIELKGSEAWTDYAFKLKTNFISGTAFSLIARYKDNKNYVSCTFETQGYARIDDVVNGTSHNLVELKNQIPTIPHVTDISYGIIVKGDEVQCTVNGSPITATVPDISPNGGVGIKVYNKALGSSEIDVQEVGVSVL